MISYTEAFIKAKETREEIDSCIEYENKVKFLEWKYNNKVNFEDVRVFLQQNIYESNYSF